MRDWPLDELPGLGPSLGGLSSPSRDWAPFSSSAVAGALGGRELWAETASEPLTDPLVQAMRPREPLSRAFQVTGSVITSRCISRHVAWKRVQLGHWRSK